MESGCGYPSPRGSSAFIADGAWAGKVKISGTHSAAEIEATCNKVMGAFLPGGPGGSYSCEGPGGVVTCNKKGKCVGTCELCGARIVPSGAGPSILLGGKLERAPGNAPGGLSK